MLVEKRRLEMPLAQLIAECDGHLCSLGYSKWSLGMYRGIWSKFTRYAELQGQDAFTASFAEKYLYEEYNLTDDDSAKTAYQKNLILAMRRLSDFMSCGQLYTKKVKVKHKVRPEALRQLLGKFYEQYSKKVVPNTLDRAKHDIEKFMNYLDDIGIVDFQHVTLSEIHEFIMSIKKYGYSSKTITDILARIRFLCSFAYENNYHKEDMSVRISTMRTISSRYVPTTYTKEEIARLLEAIDRGNPVGKRDYAIMIMATRLGMRAGDIRELKLENLHWETDSISFVQRKTKTPISLPLLSDVGDAIIDYLKNGRPPTKSKNIFVNHIAPNREFAEHNSMYRIMSKYLTVAGIDTHGRQRGLHSLRHSLAGSLLEADVSLPLISEILGHNNSETTGDYLKIDLNNLRKCALEVSL